MADANPYATPEAAATAQAPLGEEVGRSLGPAEIREAIRRLDEHLASAERVAEDERSAGRRLRIPTLVCLGLGVAAVGILAAGAASGSQPRMIGGGACALILLIIGGVLLGQDLSLPSRRRSTDPATALRGWLAALRMGRGGYVLASLGPAAREQEAATPDLAPVETAAASYRMDDPRAIRLWCRCFASAGNGQVRWMKIRTTAVLSAEGDVAEVAAEVRIQSWPQWANVVSILLFLFIRLFGLVAAVVLFYALRKRRTVLVRKTLIRGRDGRWYLVDPAFPAP